jgi:acetylornithine deacetylase/succinyl-diaminopimelate desuccinylase-like protein
MTDQEKRKQYMEEHFEEAVRLLRTLGRIPAPSHKEDQRVEFCRNWFGDQGAEDVYVDEAKNVVCRMKGKDTESVIVIMAHMDVVFPDETMLPLREENGCLYAPGIGDDTANLVNLMMAAKYVLEQGLCPETTLLVVANSCEEGLGNLKGSRQIYKDYGSRIREWISFDGVLGECVNRAVGSYRYRVSVNVRGGHSYSDFGRENAIAVLAEIIHDLYQIEPPFGEKTTYNVGTIEGGTTVNSIAQSASMLYEFRSASQKCLKEMEERFRAVIRKWQEDGNREAVCRKRASGKNFGKEITVEVLGVRPGNGPVNEKRLEELTRVNVDLIESCISGTVTVRAGSTDANIPLSEGIPANTFGTVRGGLEHTREEWMEIESMREGMLVAMGTLARYCTASGKTIL